MIDLYDRAAVASVLREANPAIHAASPGDATSAALDSAMVDAVTSAFANTGKPYLHIGGAWVYGNNTAISRRSPCTRARLVSWKESIQRRVLGDNGLRGAVIVSSVAYGDGGGLPGLLGFTPDSAGNLIMLGTGRQRPGCSTATS